MTTRDPRSPGPPRAGSSQAGQPRDARAPSAAEHGHTGADDAHPSLAIGTHEAQHERRTKLESPGVRAVRPASREAREAREAADRVGTDGEDPNLRIGHTLGSYQLVELLGKGGMGYVYRAEHVKLGREVALKLLRADYARRRDAVARFFQEAKTVNRVRHRNIVDVTDFIELDDGTTFIIMELLTGTSLGRWARGGIEVTRLLAVLVQICDGLAAAHAVGVVHRDLKPDNVIVMPTADGAEQVKLLDFGVAKLLNRDDEDIGFQTAAGSVIGTPAYMSPEQAGGMLIDARSDIYSLGAIMYELFCGQPMFRGRSFGEYVRKHLTEQPVPPHATPGGAAIDDRIEATILRCLEKDPEQRYATVGELRDELLWLLGGDDDAVARAPNASLIRSGLRSGVRRAVDAPHATSMPAVVRTTPLWMWAGGGALAVGFGVAAAVWYASGRDAAPIAIAPAAPIATTTSTSNVPVVSPTLTLTPTPTPTPTPVVEPLIELRFDSLPSGAVFEDGHAAELCRTPCAFHVDLHDGGAADRRTFLVKRAGYRDGSVTVDFAAAQRAFAITLTPIEKATASAPVAHGKSPTPTPTITPTPTPSAPAVTKPGPIGPADTLDPFHTP